MRRIQAFILLIALFGLLMPLATLAQKSQSPRAKAAQTGAARPGTLPALKVTEFKLKNGLRVIFHEDHSTPIVGVNLWYHVGSKNEVPGKTGYAHLFEHMMFQGSKGYDDDFFRPLQEAGGTLNGSTNRDRTNYWEVVPSNFLELALFMEADRMSGLLEVLNEAKLANQREVVKNEKRQNYDNQPYGLVGAKIAETLYPPSHPYHWLTIGSLDDLSAASLDDIKAFFRTYYTPRNASLAIAGDFNASEARRLVERYFGPIASGPQIERPKAPQPKLTETKYIGMQDRVTLPRLYMVWPSHSQFTADEPATDVLAYVLGSGKSSRLYKTLIYDRQIAQDVSASNNSQEIAGQFQIQVTGRPDKGLADLETVVNEEIKRIQKDGPTSEEIERAFNAREAAFIFGMQTVGGGGGKNDRLNMYATFVGQPNYVQQDLDRYRRVTAEDVKRVANTYLTEARLIAKVTPRPRDESAPRGGGRGANPPQQAQQQPTDPDGEMAATKKRAGDDGRKWKLPEPKPDPQLRLPQIQHRKLSNGLEVVIVEHHELPVVNMNLVIKAGAASDGAQRAGLASLTADLLDEGTRTRSALELSDAFNAIGAQLNVNSNWDSSSAGVLTLTRHFDKALELYTDVITNPAFKTDEMTRLLSRRKAAVKQQRDNANAVANVVYSSILYGPDHPYGHPAFGDEKSLAEIGDADVRMFYNKFYRPNNATLIVVGDVTADNLMPKLENSFSAWKAGDVPRIEIPEPAARDRAGLYIVDRPGSAQSVISIGQIGAARSTPDYFPLLVLNSMLGGQFVSRVNLNLREDKGYSYGARTAFTYRRGRGPFTASAGVFTNVTKESVAEFMKELRGIRGDIPITQKELEFAKQAIIRAFPRGFETPAQIGGRLEDVVVYGLPDDYFNRYIQRVSAVTLADVNRVARQYLDPSKMAILVVGDRKEIEPGLRSLQEIGATITYVDSEGKPVARAAGERNTNPEK